MTKARGPQRMIYCAPPRKAGVQVRLHVVMLGSGAPHLAALRRGRPPRKRRGQKCSLPLQARASPPGLSPTLAARPPRRAGRSEVFGPLPREEEDDLI